MISELDVIVIGSGHAGVEAAWAAARLGRSVGLCTLSRETVAHMPCNPAVGGTAKGHLVREIDALGGLMGRAIDATGIQFKLLNRSRGPAVWSPRAQADKPRYAAWVRAALEAEPNIHWIIGRAGRIVLDAGRVAGLALEDGTVYRCRSLVITTGTFLNGLVHVGQDQRPAGRADEPPSRDLAESIKALGVRWGRLKTGTPPRLARKSIDFAEGVKTGVFHVEHGDSEPVPFSFTATTAADEHRRFATCCTPPIACTSWSAPTSTHSPLYNGQIAGIGPRYCPSLEDKVMRFPDRERHQLYLEPEGLDVEEIYVNGFSMSLPAETQRELIHALPGLESAEMLRPGYAVEYDFVQPTELRSSLETHRVAGPVLRRADQRHVWLRGGGRTGPAGRHQRLAVGSRPAAAGAWRETRPIWASWWTTWSPRAASSPTGCSRPGPSTACCCAPTTPTSGSRRRAATWAWWTTSAGSGFSGRKARYELECGPPAAKLGPGRGRRQGDRRPGPATARSYPQGPDGKRGSGHGNHPGRPAAGRLVGRDDRQVRGLSASDSSRPSRGRSTPSAGAFPKRFPSNGCQASPARWSSASQRPAPKHSARPSGSPASPRPPSPSLAPT